MSYPYQIKSLTQYHSEYERSVKDPEGFWADIADNFFWRKKWSKVLDWNFTEPKIEWFKEAKLNITENCIDRHLQKLGDKPAIIWEPNNPEERTRIVTYNRLHKRVCQFAQVLKNNGVKKGDRVCIYMGMVPELAYAILGCARIGAIHSVIFGGFSAQSIADRLEDAKVEFIVTCDGAYRGGKDIPLKSIIDDALIGNKTVKRVIVYTRTRTPVSMIKGRDVWWEDEMEFAEGQLEKSAPSRPSPEGKEPGASQLRETARNSSYGSLKELSKQNRGNPTAEENLLWQCLQKNKTGYHIRRQHIIDEYITDFVCLKKKLVIEVDGGYHDTPEQKMYDEARTKYLENDGYVVMRFSNEQVKVDVSAVVDEIKQKLNSMADVGKVLPSGEDLGGAEEMDAEDPLFILYTSGSTGKPKGVVHTCAGYMVWTTYTFVNVFQYQPGEVFFCTADIGWITGHSYIVYGPLSAGATSLMFEGIPTYPTAGRFWDIIDKHKVNILYTAPTAIRSLMSYGLDPLKGKDLSSLKTLGTVGEPINEEAWHWYDENIGKKKCPIVDTWWQTETGACLISNMAGVTPAKPSWATLPMPGVQAVLVDENGKEITAPSQPSPVGKGQDSARPRDTARSSTYGLMKELNKHHKDNPTEEENILWQSLRANKTGYHIRRQHIIDELIVDFVCLQKNLTIEVDGGYHITSEQKELDMVRTNYLKELGYEEIRFTNDEVRHNIDTVVEKIKQKLNNMPDAGKVSSTGGDLEGAILSGNLCIKFPWPGILRTTWGDHERCRTNYFATYPGLYFTGDGALKDENGFFRITGRVDDVLNISGHRIGTAEVENAINMHAGVIESAVVGYPHDIKGQGIYAYVIYNGHHGDEDMRRQDILQTVTRVIGAIAKPDKIQFVKGLPKTRSGKIMRRILRKIAEGETQNLGDTTTLLDPAVVDEIKNNRL